MSSSVSELSRQWVRSRADELAIDAGCYFDLAAADRVRTFFAKFLRHSKGQFAGRPFELLDWQWSDFIGPLYGWRRADGTRRFRRGYCQIAKKNGKSTLCAGITIYSLVADHEPGAEIYSAAADRRQASIVFNEAATMVRSSPALAKRIKIRDSRKAMYFPDRASSYEALSADVATKEGLNAHAIIIDELHAHKTRNLYDALRYAGASRRQPLAIAITTAGYDKESVCYEQYRYAKRVLEGKVKTDYGYFALIYEAGQDDDWRQESTWEKANPSYGATVNKEDFAAAAREADENPALENAFRRYRLNQWTEQETRWISVERWDKCKEKTDWSKLAGEECFAALDLASVSDINAFALWFPKPQKLKLYFWVPEATIKRRRKEGKTKIGQWCREGHIKVTKGNVTDYDIIRDDINTIGNVYDLHEIAIDRWNALQIANQLEGDGFKIVLFGQGFHSMSAPTKEFDRRISSRQLKHDGNPVLRWMVRNVTVETDSAENYKPSKKKSSEKIDGVTAAIMAIGRGMAALEETGGTLDLI
jgi:phage terminase large subunit-like protein